MRTVLAAVAAALLSVPLAGPATASGAVVATCVVTYDDPGRYTYGTGNCEVTGTVNGDVFVGMPGSLRFSTVNGCPSQAATGLFVVSWHYVTFNLTRIGTQGVITTAGAVNGGGSATFSSPCPVSGEIVALTITGS